MQGGLTLDPAAVERFRADVARLVPPLTPKASFGVAVSGGGDSLALLLLAHAAFPGQVCAATVDHELRPEAAKEAASVAAQCDRLGVAHVTLRLGPKRQVTVSNLQERARLIRYWLLDDWAQEEGLGLVATAHHRDDIAETFLMRANRGAGVRSLAAMRPVRTLNFSKVQLVRPLLEWSRAELMAVVSTAGLKPIDDPSNADARYDRVRMRHLLAGNSELVPERLARTAANLRDVEEAIEWFVLEQLTVRFEDDGDDGSWLHAVDLPFEFQRRFVLRAIEGVRQENGRFEAWRETAVPELIRTLQAGRGGTVADVEARAIERRWHFRLAPPRRE